MRRTSLTGAAAVLIMFLVLSTAAIAQEKIKIEKLDDLPRHTYTIEGKAAELFDNDEALMKLVTDVKHDLEADLEKYDIQDKTTLKGYYGQLGTIALLEKRFDDYLSLLEQIVELEDKEASRLTAGLFTRAFIKATAGPEDKFMETLKAAYTESVKDLPYETVEPALKSAKGNAEIFSANLVAGLVDSRLQPILDESNGVMSKDIASSLIRYNHLVRNYLPYKGVVIEVLSTYLDAHKVTKDDIWAEREYTISEKDGGNPVTVCIWDSGLDTDIFGDQLWVNKAETPGNGVDDDNNGFVDDVHGIAYTLHADKTPELLFPVDDAGEKRPYLQKLTKGLSDIGANVESDEATELKKTLSNMEQIEVQPFIESISKYGNYAHGTHVAGIAARGNPNIRLMTSRLTFGYKMIPECPTIEQAHKDAAAGREAIEYYQKNGARVVNMSWGGDYAGVESALEANNAGGTPEERKKLAREIFEISKQGLFEAMRDAPEILFITSAGNSNNDVEFDEVIPSSFDLPNLMVVGAVDQAGDETGFTSFGDVDVYANGYEVESYVPGGDKMNMSGTSQASPNVTNLAAKMLSINPDLTPVQIREMIVKAADETKAGDRVMRLVNPKKTIAMMSNQ